MKNKTYDILKQICTIFLPALQCLFVAIIYALLKFDFISPAWNDIINCEVIIWGAFEAFCGKILSDSSKKYCEEHFNVENKDNDV